MVSKHEYWATQAGEPLFQWHGTTGTHTVMATGVETSVTIMFAEMVVGLHGDESAQIVVQESSVTIARGDYMKDEAGQTWRVLESFVQEDGHFQLECTRAHEVN